MGKLQSKTVVVVDDEPALALTYRLFIQREGHAAFSAESYQDAVNTLSECDAVDLLLTDLALDSKYTGFDVIDAARSRFPELPCVIITGYATDAVIDRATAIGVLVLHKPVPIEYLLETIRKSLDVTATLDRKAS
ncbi:MAG TPA: response regulator [Terriglobales bacterium]|nr:response regulator [Terriglobales bacterium]